MKKSLFIVGLSFALLIMGCAEKKTVALGGDSKAIEYETDKNAVINSGEYETVDLYSGSGEYTDNSSYGATTSSGGIQNIYFAVDQYIITSDKLPLISNNAKLLEGARVKIEGHCDATGTDEYNYALGLRRARAAKEALISRGINPSNVTMVSMGESSPECSSGFSSECYAKNRRVEFKVIR